MKQLLFIITLLFSFNTMAQDSYKDILDYEVPEGTVSLCKEKHSSGYNWENGEWVPVNYDTNEYIIKKIPYEDIATFTHLKLCRDINQIENTISSGINRVNRCYTVKKFSEEPSLIRANKCVESYWYDEGGNKGTLNSITCKSLFGIKEISFLPNGLFINEYLALDLDSNPEDGIKDSMVLSHGMCGTIN